MSELRHTPSAGSALPILISAKTLKYKTCSRGVHFKKFILNPLMLIFWVAVLVAVVQPNNRVLKA